MEEIRVMMAYVENPKPTDFKEIRVLINKHQVISIIALPNGYQRLHMESGIVYDSTETADDLREKLA